MDVTTTTTRVESVVDQAVVGATVSVKEQTTVTTVKVQGIDDDHDDEERPSLTHLLLANPVAPTGDGDEDDEMDFSFELEKTANLNLNDDDDDDDDDDEPDAVITAEEKAELASKDEFMPVVNANSPQPNSPIYYKPMADELLEDDEDAVLTDDDDDDDDAEGEDDEGVENEGNNLTHFLLANPDEAMDVEDEDDEDDEFNP